MHDMSKETFLRPDQLKRGVEIELTQRPEWGTAFIRGRVRGYPKLWDISKSMDKRGRFINEDELLQHWRTPNMSNTRKEIAARLGFAAGNGAKAEFAAHPSWSEGILGKDTDPKLAAYSWISKNNIESGRKQMLLADLAAGMYEKNPSMSIAQAVLAAAKDMVSKGVATRDIQQWAENGGKFARPGAKAEFAIDARDELMMRTWIKNNYPKADNAAFNKMLAKMTKEYAKDPKGYTYGGGFRAVAKAAGFSRDSAKATMTREQSEEQKAGLKIMSAADPAVGAKIATLIKEGKPQDQAVAIALDMKRRGEL